MIFDRHASLKKIKSKETKLMNKPWISNELIKMLETNFSKEKTPA